MVGWLTLFDVQLSIPWAALWGILFITGFGVIGFMLALCGLVLLWKDVRGDFLQMGLGVLSGMTMPTQLLPRPLWMASRAIPLAYGIEAARRLLEGAP